MSKSRGLARLAPVTIFLSVGCSTATEPHASTASASADYVCGAGLSCSASPVDGATACRQDNGSSDDIYCCAGGWSIVDGVCSPSVAPRVIVVVVDPYADGAPDGSLREAMGWNDPVALSDEIVSSIRDSSAGMVDYRIAAVVQTTRWPMMRCNGFRYDEQSYRAAYSSHGWYDCPQGASYQTLFDELGLADELRATGASEVWLWTPPNVGFDEYAMKIPGNVIPYPTDNPWFYRPYDIPDVGRTTWVMGFTYERGLGEAIHSYGHRIEGIMSLTVGRGRWDDCGSNPWTHFAQYDAKCPGDAQVGTVHFPPNGTHDYDYDDANSVLSGAEQWAAYPNGGDGRSWVSRDTWGGDDRQANYLKWWMAHLPRQGGVRDGFDTNWWQYVATYDNAVGALPPPDASPAPAQVARF